MLVPAFSAVFHAEGDGSLDRFLTPMKNWTVRQRIIASFAAVLLLMGGMATVAHLRLAEIQLETHQVEADSLPGLYFSAQALADWSIGFSLTQHYVLQTDKAAMEKTASRLLANRAALDQVMRKYEATVTLAKDRELFEDFKGVVPPFTRLQDEVLKLGGELKTAEAQAIARNQLEPLFEKGLAALQAVMDFNKHNADEEVRQVFGAIASARQGMLVSLGAALFVGLLSAWFLARAITQPLARLVAVMDRMRNGDFSERVAFDRRDEFGTLGDGFNRMTDELTALVGQVQKSGIQVNTSATEIAATAKQQQATASEIAATTTEIGATSTEISATSKELVKTMGEVARTAEQTAAIAEDGRTGLTRMEATMAQVTDAVGTITGKLAVLNEKAGNISSVVTTITQVADQTNLLSLNAAIEAEKAGEFGRGFAVVAREIRRLADQTAVASSDIGEMVKEMQSAVSAGVMGMDKFSEEVRRAVQEVRTAGVQLAQIIEQVQALTPRIETVNEGMQAQATGASQISEALAQLSEGARQTAESLRQSNEAIQQLNEATGGLQSGVARFKLRT